MRKIQGRGHEWTAAEESDLKKYWPDISKSFKFLTKKFDRSISAIRQKARKMGIWRDERYSRSYHRMWSDDEEEYLKNNYERGDIGQIAEHLGRTKKAIRERAKALKIKRDEKIVRLNARKITANINFFRHWSNEMAYILGLICTDGDLTKTGNAFGITQHTKDKYILQNVLNHMHSDAEVKEDSRGIKCSRFAIESKDMYDDLLALKLEPAKSKTLNCPNVPHVFIPHFLRGVIDGDGCVYLRCAVKISSASKGFADGVCKLLGHYGIYSYVRYDPYKHNGKMVDFYNVRMYRKSDIKRLYNVLYHNTSDLYLTRKKQTFIDMGVENDDFEIKYKSAMKPVIGICGATGNKIEFESVKDAKQSGWPKIHISLNNKRAYKGYRWYYKSELNGE